MRTKLIVTVTAATIISAVTGAAFAAPEPTPWVLAPDIAYGYTRDGKTFAYKLGTSNAREFWKGAKKVSKDTLFFMGANGQLYMRQGPFLEDNGGFKFGPEQP